MRIYILYDPAIPHLRISSKEIFPRVVGRHTMMFIAALFVIASTARMRMFVRHRTDK